MSCEMCEALNGRGTEGPTRGGEWPYNIIRLAWRGADTSPALEVDMVVGEGRFAVECCPWCGRKLDESEADE